MHEISRGDGIDGRRANTFYAEGSDFSCVLGFTRFVNLPDFESYVARRQELTKTRVDSYDSKWHYTEQSKVFFRNIFH